MRPQQLMAAAGVFIIGTLLCCLLSGRWLLDGEINIIRALASFNAVDINAGGGWSAIKNGGDYWNAITTALTWNYPFLSSGWAIFVKIPLWLSSIGVVWGFIQILIGLVQGVIGAIRNIVS